MAAFGGVSIDDLLSWTFRTELPKAARARMAGAAGGPSAPSSDTMAMMRELGTRVQTPGWQGGGFDTVVIDGPPDPDALLVAEAVKGLDSLVIDLDGVGLLDDAAFDGLTSHERACAHAESQRRALAENGRLRSSLSALVVAGAVLGRPAPVRVTEPVQRHVIKAHGKPLWFRTIWREAGEGRAALPVETNGYDPRRMRPYPGAYRKFTLDPDPVPIVAERIEY
jgi:hypothetical protein